MLFCSCSPALILLPILLLLLPPHTSPLSFPSPALQTQPNAGGTSSPLAGGASSPLAPPCYLRRRRLLASSLALPLSLLPPPPPARAATFTPGGTLVDTPVGITEGNPAACPLRSPDNSNVLFKQDYYFKFGRAPAFIEPGDTSFPAAMPFVMSKQRYDALKALGGRVSDGARSYADCSPPSSPAPPLPSLNLRPAGLLANSLLASENAGAPNELFLARWFINEVQLCAGGMAAAPGPGGRAELYETGRRAYNSYLTLMNRQITAKVGDPFAYIPPP